MTTQTYGVQYRNMNTAIHGLLLFETEEAAINANERLGFVEANGSVKMKENVFESAYAEIETIDWRKVDSNPMPVEFSLNNDGFVSTQTGICHIVNPNMARDIY